MGAEVAMAEVAVVTETVEGTVTGEEGATVTAEEGATVMAAEGGTVMAAEGTVMAAGEEGTVMAEAEVTVMGATGTGIGTGAATTAEEVVVAQVVARGRGQALLRGVLGSPCGIRRCRRASLQTTSAATPLPLPQAVVAAATRQSLVVAALVAPRRHFHGLVVAYDGGGADVTISFCCNGPG